MGFILLPHATQYPYSLLSAATKGLLATQSQMVEGVRPFGLTAAGHAVQ